MSLLRPTIVAVLALPIAMLAMDSGSRTPVVAPCSTTVEAAAHAIFGDAAGGSGQAGYRAQDVVIDPVLRKIWVRVADCNDSRRPLTLVPVAAPLAGGMGTAPQTSGQTAATPLAQMVIHRGDAVDVVVQSATMHMALHGKAIGEAAANAEIEVQLDGEVKNDQAPRRIRGIAIAEHRVEVHL